MNEFDLGLLSSPGENYPYNIPAQSAGALFNVWILDVQGVRVLVSRDFPSTSAAERAELQEIVDSIHIEWNHWILAAPQTGSWVP